MLCTLAIAKITLLSWIALASANLLRPHHGWRADGLQQPLIEQGSDLYPPPIVVTLHSTETHYHLKITTTTKTRYVEEGSTSVPQAVRDWESEQTHSTCDPMACASCETWYRCFGERSRWQVPVLRVDDSITDVLV
jgi:hypothetical protein